MTEWNCSSYCANDLNELKELNDEFILDCLELILGLCIYLTERKREEMVTEREKKIIQLKKQRTERNKQNDLYPLP